MGTNKRLNELITKEREHFDKQEVGSPEYVKSQKRLMELEKQLSERNDGVGNTVIEGVKAASGIVLPIFGLVVITAFEKNDSLTTSLKKTIDCFLPKRP